MSKKNRIGEIKMNPEISGFTLIEVLVSITIVGILFFAFIGSFISYQKLEKKIEIEENRILEIANIFEIFDANPSHFYESISFYYCYSYDEEIKTIFYDSYFFPKSNGSIGIILSIEKEETDFFDIFTLAISFSQEVNMNPNLLERTVIHAKE